MDTTKSNVTATAATNKRFTGNHSVTHINLQDFFWVLDNVVRQGLESNSLPRKMLLTQRQIGTFANMSKLCIEKEKETLLQTHEGSTQNNDNDGRTDNSINENFTKLIYNFLITMTDSFQAHENIFWNLVYEITKIVVNPYVIGGDDLSPYAIAMENLRSFYHTLIPIEEKFQNSTPKQHLFLVYPCEVNPNNMNMLKCFFQNVLTKRNNSQEVVDMILSVASLLSWFGDSKDFFTAIYVAMVDVYTKNGKIPAIIEGNPFLEKVSCSVERKYQKIKAHCSTKEELLNLKKKVIDLATEMKNKNLEKQEEQSETEGGYDELHSENGDTVFLNPTDEKVLNLYKNICETMQYITSRAKDRKSCQQGKNRGSTTTKKDDAKFQKIAEFLITHSMVKAVWNIRKKRDFDVNIIIQRHLSSEFPKDYCTDDDHHKTNNNNNSSLDESLNPNITFSFSELKSLYDQYKKDIDAIVKSKEKEKGEEEEEKEGGHDMKNKIDKMKSTRAAVMKVLEEVSNYYSTFESAMPSLLDSIFFSKITEEKKILFNDIFEDINDILQKAALETIEVLQKWLFCILCKQSNFLQEIIVTTNVQFFINKTMINHQKNKNATKYNDISQVVTQKGNKRSKRDKKPIKTKRNDRKKKNKKSKPQPWSLSLETYFGIACKNVYNSISSYQSEYERALHIKKTENKEYVDPSKLKLLIHGLLENFQEKTKKDNDVNDIVVVGKEKEKEEEEEEEEVNKNNDKKGSATNMAYNFRISSLLIKNGLDWEEIKEKTKTSPDALSENIKHHFNEIGLANGAWENFFESCKKNLESITFHNFQQEENDHIFNKEQNEYHDDNNDNNNNNSSGETSMSEMDKQNMFVGLYHPYYFTLYTATLIGVLQRDVVLSNAFVDFIQDPIENLDIVFDSKNEKIIDLKNATNLEKHELEELEKKQKDIIECKKTLKENFISMLNSGYLYIKINNHNPFIKMVDEHLVETIKEGYFKSLLRFVEYIYIPDTEHTNSNNGGDDSPDKDSDDDENDNQNNKNNKNNNNNNNTFLVFGQENHLMFLKAEWFAENSSVVDSLKFFRKIKTVLDNLKPQVNKIKENGDLWMIRRDKIEDYDEIIEYERYIDKRITMFYEKIQAMMNTRLKYIKEKCTEPMDQFGFLFDVWAMSKHTDFTSY